MKVLLGCWIFLMAVLGAGAQEAPALSGTWIGRNLDLDDTHAPLLRREFAVAGEVASAQLEVCGLGYYQGQLNGRAIGDAALAQGFTRYDVRLLYDRYEVGDLLKKGNNCLAFTLGNGWYNVQSKTIWGYHAIGWRGAPKMLLALYVTYRDGRRDTLRSDGSWKAARGGSYFNSMQAGEHYDARREPTGWQLAGFDDGKWQQAVVVPAPKGILELNRMPQVKVIRKVPVKALKILGVGSWLFDLGENIAGVVELRVKGKVGDTVKLHYEEALNADGSLDRKRNSSQMMGPKTDPEFQTDIYVLKGKGTEVFRPRFTYHGFQYVQVSAPAHIRLDKKSLSGLFYSTDFRTVGSFESSDTLLNKMYEAAMRSYRGNYVSIPTDCPQREKMGWTADAHLATETGLWNFDAFSAYRKYLGDIRDVQQADGRMAGIAPTLGVGYSWIDPADRDFGPVWGSAGIMISWQLYLHSGEVDILRENYAAAKRYLEFMERRAKDGLYLTGIADWLAPVATSKVVTSTGYYYRSAQLVSKMAGVLGERSDQQSFAALAERIARVYQEKCFDVASGGYKEGTATAMSGPLYFGFAPEALRPGIAAALAARVKGNRLVPEFGMMGATFVLPALSENGQADVAYALLTNSQPGGWGASVSKGATTFYEHWNGEASLNHVWPGNFTAWLFNSLAGIRPLESAPGFRAFSLSPVFPKGLDWIRVSHETKYGRIGVDWKRKGAKVLLEVTVPEGTSCQVLLKGHEGKLGAGRHRLEIVE